MIAGRHIPRYPAPPVLVALRNVEAPAGALVVDVRNFRIYRDRIAIWRPLQLRNGSSVSFRIFALLLAALPRGVLPHGDLIEALWGDDPEGGPGHAVGYVAAKLSGESGQLFRAATGLRVISDFRKNYILRYVPPRP